MVKLFIDSADSVEISTLIRRHPIVGVTTNPSIMRKTEVRNYERWARNLCYGFPSLQLSFEVIADDFENMERQARLLTSWGENVYAKIPITNTKGQSSVFLVNKLAKDGVKLNITAILTYSQINEVMAAVTDTPAIVSVFAGRIADTGRDPVGAINHAVSKKPSINTEVLWASPRQVLDVYTAGSIGCDIITATPDIIKKLPLECKNLAEYSLDTVRMFFNDAKAAGYTL